ncbi:MAG: hypothetical protein ACQ9ET_00555 [Nitrosomonadaceae bacterium]
MDSLKVAVCISGVCEGNAKQNIEMLQSQFPYDFFFGVWEQTKVSNDLGAIAFREPATSYHPYCDITNCTTPKFNEKKAKLIRLGKRDAVYEKTQHQSKQIIAHAHLLDYIPQQYNMIIRTRYDVIISNKIDYTQHIERAYHEKCAIGFGTLYNLQPTMHEILPARPRSWDGYLQDTFIIHPRALFDTARAFDLYDKKQLRAAEFGWYQILSEPHGDNHICFYGGSQINRAINNKDLQTQNDNKNNTTLEILRGS